MGPESKVTILMALAVFSGVQFCLSNLYYFRFHYLAIFCSSYFKIVFNKASSKILAYLEILIYHDLRDEYGPRLYTFRKTAIAARYVSV